ncbi:MAG TPA: MOP flippase family protein [Candidatus Krumholzibacteria bacterium]|nr:MOP flippase family protein [Candidatus Krumholzibacteria bacterium]
MSHDVDIKKLRKSATSGARWTGTSTGVRILAQFIQLAVLARLLKVSDFGLMAMVNVALAFAQGFADSGVSNAIIHYRDAKREELASLYWLNVISGVSVFVLMWFASPLVGKLYHQPLLVNLLRVASTVFIAVSLGQQFETLSERDLRFKRLASIEMTSVVVGAVVGIWLAAHGNGVWSLVWANLVAAVVKSGTLAVIGWSTWRPLFHFRPGECRRFIRFGLFQMGEKTLNILGQQLDKLVIGVVMGATPLGYYDMASRLISRPYQIINPIFTRVAFPVFSAVQSDRERLRKGYLELMEVLTGLTIPLYVGMMALAPSFVLVQLGDKFIPSIPLLRILCLVGFAFALSSPAGSLILACGRADIGFYMNIIRTGMILLGIWVGAHWGLVGVAWAMVAVVTAVMFPVHAYVRWKLVRMTLGEFMRVTYPFMWCSAAAAIPAVLGHYVIRWPSAIVELLVLFAIAAAVYAGLLWWTARPRILRVVRLVKS